MKTAVIIFTLLAYAFAVPAQNGMARIVGGNQAKEGQFPYTASLQFKFGGIAFSHVCGAVIVSPNWSITAAQCRDSFDLSRYRIVAGLINLSEFHPSVQITGIEEFILHPDYHGGQGKFDIGLLLHSVILSWTDVVSPAKLPASVGPTPAGDALISGWGSGKPLLWAKQRLHSYDECVEVLIDITGSVGPFDSNQVCAGGEVRVCNEDLGSPLVKDDVVIGLYSWSPCEFQIAPAVFVKVDSHLDFIHKHVDDL